MNKLSVIIPAYNAVKTIERTVRSVMASTVPLDVWIVDDGSTDGTGELLDGLVGGVRKVGEMSGSGTAELKSSVPLSNSNSTLQLKVIHQPNSGAYQARLNALKQIRTPYFGFVDADDTIEPDMFEKMLGMAKKEQLDVVQVGYKISGLFDLGLDDCLIGEEKIYQTVVKPIMWEGRDSSFIWDKLYRNQYDFSTFDPTDHVTNFDDLIFNLQFFTKVKRMGFINEPLYHYNETVGSAARKFKWKLVRDFRETLRIRRKMAPAYGVRPRGWLNIRWALKNFRNLAALWIKSKIKQS